MSHDIQQPEARSQKPEARGAVLSCSGIHCYLGEGELRNHVLRGVSLNLMPNELCSIVGPSGCGKSSLLYLLGLLDRVDEGEIWIHGKELAAASDTARTEARNHYLGFIFQFHFLLPEFTALENVMMPMKKTGRLGVAEMESKAHDLLMEMGLGDKSRRLTTQLSGGEQQRVAVARALANDPDVILADEPTGNLDIKNSNQVFDLMQKVAEERGQAVLMVTHNLDLAERAHRIYRMQDGEFLRS